jgi:hypothetical protein
MTPAWDATSGRSFFNGLLMALMVGRVPMQNVPTMQPGYQFWNKPWFIVNALVGTSAMITLVQLLRLRKSATYLTEEASLFAMRATLGIVGRIAMGFLRRSASFTQRCKTLALSPRAKATAAIDTPDCWQAPTASAFDSSLWRLRRRRPVSMTCPIALTYTPIS